MFIGSWSFGAFIRSLYASCISAWGGVLSWALRLPEPCLVGKKPCVRWSVSCREWLYWKKWMSPEIPAWTMHACKLKGFFRCLEKDREIPVCKRIGCEMEVLAWEMKDPPLERRWVVTDGSGEKQHFLPSESGLLWTHLSALGCHLRVRLRLGATACNRGGYMAAGAKGEFLAGSSRKPPHTTCRLHHTSTLGEGSRRAEDVHPPPVPLSAPCAMAPSVQHPCAPKPGWHVLPAINWE